MKTEEWCYIVMDFISLCTFSQYINQKQYTQVSVKRSDDEEKTQKHISI